MIIQTIVVSHYKSQQIIDIGVIPCFWFQCMVEFGHCALI